MKIVVSGGRWFGKVPKQIDETYLEKLREYNFVYSSLSAFAYEMREYSPLEFISGGARGVDEICKIFCREQ